MLIFEWDEEKNELNLQKHGIDFNLAQYVFADPYHVELYDLSHSVEEDRYKIIGMVGKLLVVISTFREDAIRIISAREADTNERKVYEKNYKKHHK